MSLLYQLEGLNVKIGYAELHLDRATESPTERQIELSDWLDDAYMSREELLERMGLPSIKPEISEKIVVKEKPFFSRMFESFLDWLTEPHKTTVYSKRITSYMSRHPTATLKEARGHGKK